MGAAGAPAPRLRVRQRSFLWAAGARRAEPGPGASGFGASGPAWAGHVLPSGAPAPSHPADQTDQTGKSELRQLRAALGLGRALLPPALPGPPGPQARRAREGLGQRPGQPRWGSSVLISSPGVLSVSHPITLLPTLMPDTTAPAATLKGFPPAPPDAGAQGRARGQERGAASRSPILSWAGSSGAQRLGEPICATSCCREPCVRVTTAAKLPAR